MEPNSAIDQKEADDPVSVWQILKRIIQGLSLGMAMVQCILLMVIQEIPSKRDHAYKMEFILLNGFIGVIAAGLAIATRKEKDE
jgi:hypothetical protein